MKFMLKVHVSSFSRYLNLSSKTMNNFKIYDATDWQTNNDSTHIIQYLKKQKQTDKETCQLIEYITITCTIEWRSCFQTISQNQNWTYLRTNALKCYTNCFYCMSKWTSTKIYHKGADHLFWPYIKLFQKTEVDLELVPSLVFCMIFEELYFSLYISWLPLLLYFLRYNLSRNYFLNSLQRLEFWN